MARPHELVGPAILQALQLARYQVSRSNNKDIVQVDENDVISQKPTREEERIMASNASVVSALEDLFSWIYKDKTSRTSQLSFVESWRFHRATYRVWIMSTLYGHGSALHGQYAKGASSEIQKAFLCKFTSQELIQISKVCRFLQSLAGWAVFAECKLVGSLDVYDFNGLYLFSGPHIILRCFEEQSSDPLPFGYDDEVYEDFLLPPAENILSQRNVTIPLAFVGSILDEVCGANDACRACGRNGLTFLPHDTQCTPDLYNEQNWARLKGNLGTSSDIFLKLAYNAVEKPLFKILREANYDALFHELFPHRSEPFLEWTKRDWICLDCIRDFFVKTVFRWWRQRKLRAGESVPQDCRHGYYCKDQCFEAGLNHARRFNHACVPVDEIASLAQFHGR